MPSCPWLQFRRGSIFLGPLGVNSPHHKENSKLIKTNLPQFDTFPPGTISYGEDKFPRLEKLLRSRIQHLANFLILEQYIGIACQSFGNVHGKKGLGFFPDGKKGRFSSWWGRKMKQHESIHISYDFTLLTIFH